MGKAGGRELTVASDLDLIFVYDIVTTDDEETVTAQSDGPRPLAAMTYFTRLSQRLVSAIESQTGEGRLYEVDLRLRPSGAKGPLACTVDSFESYQQMEAWTWEHMALTRARVITGPAALRRRIEATLRRLLTRRRNPGKLVADVADMRQRIAQEHKVLGPWHLKHGRGGLVDVEFLAQYLQLRHGADRPDVLAPNTIAALSRMAVAGAIGAEVGQRLVAAADLLTRLHELLRLTVGEDLNEASAPAGLKARLARAGSAPDLDQLQRRLASEMAYVRQQFEDLIETPAARYRSVSDPEDSP
ncbi:MAG: bifunctional [glutamine synthetase] adenylyltransferase/[glutamine synthetase]-adenylyl-L-tyrosine phosphorylase, partial [Alphaproteobacteria bacterium]|nr:bifunctional [glutamine synthetase] adenylyltransferase/[glutamine synthetase]-adenylyl-L-tyrosine phosphorylase [Alphaproteobacteria bacterium]